MTTRDAKGRFAATPPFRPGPQPFMPPAAWRNMAPNPAPKTGKDPDLSPARCVGMAAMLVSLVFVVGAAVAAFSGALHWG